MKKIIILLAISALAFTWADKPAKKNFRYAKTLESAFVNESGQMNGQYERTFEGKEVESGTYINGKKEGQWISKNPDGLVVKRLTYKNDLLDGEVFMIYPDGKPRVKGSFKNGLKIGQWSFYYKDGAVAREGMYNDAGVATGVWTYYDNDNHKVVEKYDFDSKTSLVDNRANLHFDNDNEKKIKNVYMGRNERIREIIDVPLTNVRLVGGNRKAKELYNMNLEIPHDIWYTFVAQTYFTAFKLSKQGVLSDVKVTRVKETDFNLKGSMDYFYYTEYPESLQRVSVDERTLYHFADMIRENFIIFYGPWIVTSDKDLKAEVQMSYTVNQ